MTKQEEERVLTDVTNKMDVGPVSVKPSQAGPHPVTANLNVNEFELSKKAHECGAQVNNLRLSGDVTGRACGLGVIVGLHSTRPPDLDKRGDKVEYSGHPQIDQTTDEGGKGGAKQGGVHRAEAL